MNTQNVGKVISGDWSRGGRRVRGRPPGDLQRRARGIREDGHQRGDRRRRRGAAAPRREPRPRGGDEADRRHAARHARHRHQRADPGAGRPGDARPRAERAWRAGRLPRPSGRGEGALADSPPRADARGAVDRAQDVRDRHQGHRPARAVPAGRQDRALRRRRRRQDRHHHGAHQQHRHEARRRVGVRRRRRAHARRQRPLARVPGDRRHRHERHVEVACRARLRPDDGAAGRASARRSLGPDGRRVLPRRREQGRAALHRQHLPLHAGGLGSVGAARPHAVGGRLPADAAVGDGRAAGAHHLDQERLDHVGAGHLRARRRLHRPGAGHDLRPPRRDDQPVARRSPSSASTRPSIRWRRPRASSTRASSATSTTTWPAR